MHANIQLLWPNEPSISSLIFHFCSVYFSTSAYFARSSISLGSLWTYRPDRNRPLTTYARFYHCPRVFDCFCIFGLSHICLVYLGLWWQGEAADPLWARNFVKRFLRLIIQSCWSHLRKSSSAFGLREIRVLKRCLHLPNQHQRRWLCVAHQYHQYGTLAKPSFANRLETHWSDSWLLASWAEIYSCEMMS